MAPVARDVDAAATPAQVFDAVDDFLARSQAKAPEPGRPGGLDARGFAKRLIEDVRRRFPLYVGDLVDGLPPKSVAATRSASSSRV